MWAMYYVWKSCIVLAVTGIRKNSNVACGFSPIKIHYSDYPKRKKEVLSFFNKILLQQYFIENT